MSRGLRIFLAALLIALLAYWIAVGSSRQRWSKSAQETALPVEAHLPSTEPAVTAPVITVSGVPQTVTSAPEVPVQPEARLQPESRFKLPQKTVAVAPAPAKNLLPETATKPVSQPTLPVGEVDATTATSAAAGLAAHAPSRPLSPSAKASLAESHVVSPGLQSEPIDAAATPDQFELRKLPEHIFLRFNVQYGEEGFKFGKATYSGEMNDGRYALSSVSEATGIAALLVRSKITQGSEGRITAQGLQPEKFWTEKGQRKRPPLRFDWLKKLLVLPAGAVDLPMQTQDLLSFPFHLAMRVKEGDPAWVMSVANDKSLRNYSFQVIGRETLTLGKARMETLRVQGSRSGDGNLDVWLAPERQWLPVQIRTQDQEGKVILLTLLEGSR